MNTRENKVNKISDVTFEQWELVNPENKRIVEEFINQSKQLSPQTIKQYTSGIS